MDERTPLIDIPPEFVRRSDPPKALVRALSDDSRKECGGYMELSWPKGPYKGLVATAYCSEPLCITEGRCTGPRFVPHVQQYTSLDPNDPFRRPRKPSVDELVAIAQASNEKARLKTGVSSGQTPDQIAKHIAKVWKKTLAAIRSDGGRWAR